MTKMDNMKQQTLFKKKKKINRDQNGQYEATLTPTNGLIWVKSSNLLFGRSCHNRVVQKSTLLLILEQSSDGNTKPLNTRLTDGH